MYRYTSQTTCSIALLTKGFSNLETRSQRARLFFRSCRRTFGTRPQLQQAYASSTGVHAQADSSPIPYVRSDRQKDTPEQDPGREISREEQDQVARDRHAEIELGLQDADVKDETKGIVTGSLVPTLEFPAIAQHIRLPCRVSRTQRSAPPGSRVISRKLRRQRRIEGETFRQTSHAATSVGKHSTTVLKFPAISQHLRLSRTQEEPPRENEVQEESRTTGGGGKWAKKKERRRQEAEARGQQDMALKSPKDVTAKSQRAVAVKTQQKAASQAGGEATVKRQQYLRTKSERSEGPQQALKNKTKEELEAERGPILTALRRIEMLDGPSIFKELESRREPTITKAAKLNRERGNDRAIAETQKGAEKDVNPQPTLAKARTQEAWGVQKSALERKFGQQGWQPRKRVSPDTLAGIRALNASDPATYNTETLASHFQITPEAIRRILKSKWKPSSEEIDDRMRRWERRGVAKWAEMSAQGVKPPKKWREMGVKNPDLERKVKRKRSSWENINDMADRLPMEGSLAERIV